MCIFSRLICTSTDISLRRTVTTHASSTTGHFMSTNVFTLPSWLSERAGKVRQQLSCVECCDDIRTVLCSTQWSRKKIAQILMQRHFATICSRITWFSPKCSEKTTVYQSMHNLYQLVKYSLINSRNWICVMSDITQHVNVTHLTVKDWLG